MYPSWVDCAGICDATEKLAARGTGRNAKLQAMLELCTHACEPCAGERAHHAQAHCQLCAEPCRECADDCRKALLTVQ